MDNRKREDVDMFFVQAFIFWQRIVCYFMIDHLVKVQVFVEVRSPAVFG